MFPRDGIGDTPYIIPGGESQDNFPLMEPYNAINYKKLSTPLFSRILNKLMELIQIIR